MRTFAKKETFMKFSGLHGPRWSNNYEIEEIANIYDGFGMHLTLIDGSEPTEHSWLNPYKESFVEWDYDEQLESIDEMDWEKATGMGLILGEYQGRKDYSYAYRAIDIDGIEICHSFGDSSSVPYSYEIEDRIYNFNKSVFLTKCLEILGLPQNYGWVVKSGSGKGLHIIFRAKSIDGFDSSAFMPNQYFKKAYHVPVSFERLELIWDGHLVLPPSKSQSDFHHYEFLDKSVPNVEPAIVKIARISDLLNYLCGQTVALSENKGGYLFPHKRLNLAMRNSYDMLLTDNDEIINLSQNEDWLSISKTSDSLNTLGVYYVKKKEYKKALKAFQKSNNSFSHFNIACLIALDKIEGNIDTFQNHVNQADDISDQHKTTLLSLFQAHHPETETYLFIDTETTGLPVDFNAPSEDLDNWPRMVQLSYLITDSMGNILDDFNYIISPDNYTIPKESTKIHGISTQYAKKEGVELKLALYNFYRAAAKASVIIGHNVEFDKKVIEAEFIRCFGFDAYANDEEVIFINDTDSVQYSDFDDIRTLCTMHATVNLCKIPGKSDFKYPSLKELYKFLFGIDYDNAHNAFSDVYATYSCFWKLRDRCFI